MTARTPAGESDTMERLPIEELRDRVYRALPPNSSQLPGLHSRVVAMRLAHRKTPERVYIALEELEREGRAQRNYGWWRRG
jgi:hypothetical protein